MDVSDDESDFSTQDGKECVKDIVKAVLVLDHSKKPFKLNEIKQMISKNPGRKMLNVLMEKAKVELSAMGFTLVELKDSSKSYILTSKLFPLPSIYRYADDIEVADRTLLVLVLAFIFMKEGSVTDAELLKHLEDLNIYSKEEPNHDYFGDIQKKILTNFVTQLYLEKVVEKESETCHLSWGERAVAEVTKRSILEFVCNVGFGGAIQPQNLSSHYKIVEEEEQEIGQTDNVELMEVDN